MKNCQKEFEPIELPPTECDDVYGKLEFSCSDCDQDYKYNDHSKHFKECQPIKSTCILKCGDKKQYRSKADLLHHLNQSCMKSELICSLCSEKMSVEEASRHPSQGECCTESCSSPSEDISALLLNEKCLKQDLEKATKQLKDIRAKMKTKV